MIQRKHLILLSMVGAIVSLDQFTKEFIENMMKVGESIPIIHNFFDITLVHNPGAAFGIMANASPHFRDSFFLFMPLITLSIILVLFQKLKPQQKLSIFAFSSIVGGALGNLIDRVRIGHVIDFLDFHWAGIWHFPAFNVADSAITIGVALLMLTILVEEEPSTPRP